MARAEWARVFCYSRGAGSLIRPTRGPGRGRRLKNPRSLPDESLPTAGWQTPGSRHAYDFFRSARTGHIPAPQAVLGDRLIAPSHLQVRPAFFVGARTCCIQHSMFLRRQCKWPALHSTTQPWESDTVEEPIWETNKSMRRAFGRPPNAERRSLRTFATHWPCHNAWCGRRVRC